MWLRLLTVFAIALIFSMSLTPSVRKLALKFGIVDKSNPRKSHKRVITCLGGVAIYLGFVISLVCASLLFLRNPDPPFFHNLVGLLSGATVILILGLIDDTHGTTAPVKVGLQVVAALVTSAIFGIKITYLILPVLGKIDFGVLSIPLTLIWVIGLTNALNWVDGLDGLAAGITSIACVSLLIIGWRGGELVSAVIIIALLGSTLGFLKYNFYPAKVFMGDTGSNFLGFVLANVAIMGSLKSAAILSLMIPILILGVPIFDSLFSVWRRVRLNKSPITPDRDHFHYRLIKLGLTHRQAVLVIYSISGVLSLCAIFLHRSPTLTSVAIVVFILGLLAIAAWRLNLLSVTFKNDR
jgi:UDP-GlcNAc:undecaprenyl-phosphate GlcNAc-1-phosphate transferase